MGDTHEHTGANGDRPARADDAAAGVARRRTPWPLIVVALLFVIVPSLTWYLTWFGRGLTDEELTRYLSNSNPRHAQHALSQLAERVERGDESAARWSPQVLALSRNPAPDLRMTAAWVMGLEHKSEEFRAALARLLEDTEPIVRRNAALALVRFGDPRCRAELREMLRPYAVKSPSDGTALTALTEGTHVKRGSLLVKFRNRSGEVEEVRSPLPGELARALVKDGESFAAGSDLFTLAPDAEQVRDALVGLYYLGDREDLAEVERYASGVEGVPIDLKERAAQTADAIKRRSQDGR
ncbi:MAG: HEAT repeat domain-containing protein [Pyrinomonadaceae bacterium]